MEADENEGNPLVAKFTPEQGPVLMEGAMERASNPSWARS